LRPRFAASLATEKGSSDPVLVTWPLQDWDDAPFYGKNKLVMDKAFRSNRRAMIRNSFILSAALLLVASGAQAGLGFSVGRGLDDPFKNNPHGDSKHKGGSSHHHSSWSHSGSGNSGTVYQISRNHRDGVIVYDKNGLNPNLPIPPLPRSGTSGSGATVVQHGAVFVLTGRENHNATFQVVGVQGHTLLLHALDHNVPTQGTATFVLPSNPGAGTVTLTNFGNTGLSLTRSGLGTGVIYGSTLQLSSPVVLPVVSGTLTATTTGTLLQNSGSTITLTAYQPPVLNPSPNGSLVLVNPLNPVGGTGVLTVGGAGSVNGLLSNHPIIINGSSPPFTLSQPITVGGVTYQPGTYTLNGNVFTPVTGP
jgi:hypothetical protein